MTDFQVQAVSLFFFFSLKEKLNSNYATWATLTQCKKHFRKNDPTKINDEEKQAYVVYSTYKNWKKYSKAKKFDTEEGPHIVIESMFYLPDDIHLGAWNEFMKDSKEDEMLLVIWSKILNISDAAIARGLGLTEGTIRYRVANGLKKLGRAQTR